MQRKPFLAGLTLLALMLSLTACAAKAPSAAPAQGGGDETPSTGRIFTDSALRRVEVPAQIDKVALSGPLSQIVLFALCPDKLVGVSSAWSREAAAFLDEAYLDLPQLGQIYGGKGEMNLETLLDSGAQVVIDVGEPKASIRTDMDELQARTGIPFVHISATTETAGAAYRTLGQLLGMEQEAEALAVYCETTLARIRAIADSVEKTRVLYVTGDAGQNVIARGSYHGEVLDLLTDNVAVVDAPSSKGTGNEVSMEQILAWDPEVIVFAPESIYDTVAQDAVWQGLSAVQNGRYHKVPMGPYNWMGSPPSVQQYLGMLWLSKLLYPEATAAYDLYEDVRTYFRLFYHCELSRDQFDALTAGAFGQ